MSIPFQVEVNTNFRGIQTKKALTDFDREEAVSAIGGYFDFTGSFTKRKGGEKYNTTELGSQILGIYDFRFNGDQRRVLLASGDSIYEGNAGSPLVIQSGQTASFYDFVTYDNFAWIVNGADDLLKYDGTTVTKGSVDPPGGVSVLAENVGGNLPLLGIYRVAVTFIGAGGIESNPSPISSITLTGVNNQIDVSNIPTSPDPQVTARNIYMTDSGGALLRLNKTINDNVSTVTTLTDVILGALLEFDHDPAPIGLGGIEVHKDKLFGFIDDTVYFTKSFQPASWPQGIGDAQINFSFPVGNSDPITGIKSFFDFFLIFKRDDVYVLSGDNEFNFRVDRLRSDERVGAVSNRVIDVIGNYCYFLGINSFYRTNGITVENVGEDLGDFFEQNSKNFAFKINKDFVGSSCSVYFKELNLWLAFSPTGDGIFNNTCFMMDTNSLSIDASSRKVTADWSIWPGFQATQSAAVIVENGFDRWFRGDDLGFIFREDTLDGDGSNITSFSTGGNTNLTINDTNQSWTIDIYKGLRFNVLSGTGAGQSGRIISNTATQLTPENPLATILDDTSEYTIGGIFYKYEHAWDSYGNPTLSKRWRYARPRFETQGNYSINASFGFDFNANLEIMNQLAVLLGNQALWDISLWDVALWDGNIFQQEKVPVGGNRIHRWSNFKVENNKAGQPIRYYGFDKIFQMKGIR